MSNKKRVGLSVKTRFEVFKRDNFTCQYCGAKAPDVVLECDHIEAVANGGDNNILNLITACFDCNRGKTKNALSDQSALAKQRKQVEDINAVDYTHLTLPTNYSVYISVCPVYS